MKPLATMFLLIMAMPALAQPINRERGRFSIQGSSPTLMTVDADSKYVLTAFDSGYAVVFPIDQKVVRIVGFIAHKKPVTGGAFLPDGKSFLTSSSDGTIKVWDTLAARKHHQESEKNGDSKPTNPTPIKTFTAHLNTSVVAISLSHDGKTLLTAGLDGLVKVWDMEEAKLLHTVKDVHSFGIKAIQFSADGKRFATAGGDKTAKIWDMSENGPKLAFKLEGHEGAVNAISFHHEGKYFATASGIVKKSGSVRVWDLETGKVDYKLEGSEDNVTAVIFSPNGEYLAAGGYDMKIRVWNLADKTVKYTDDHAEPAKGFINTPDGKLFGLWSKTALRWFAPIGK